MADPPKQLDLITGLISSITECRTSTVQHVAKRLREHNFARTNQFAVKSKIEGLLEKFGILGRDDLVVILQARLEALPAGDKFLPEKLALLLSLSDLPHFKVTNEDIISITERNIHHNKDQLSNILEDDWTDRDLWENIECGYHSSGDEDFVSEVAESLDTAVTSISNDNEDLARSQLVQPVESASASSLWSELKLVREVLFMLRGVTTDIFVVDHRDGKVYSSTTAILPQTSKELTANILTRCAKLGSSLNFLRGWIDSSSSRSEVRSCQATTMRYLQDFDRYISHLELRYVQPPIEVKVSILELLDKVECEGHTLLQLSSVLRKGLRSASTSILDHLLFTACEFQSIGDDRSMSTLYNIFHIATLTHIRPMIAWALSGIVEHSNHLVVDLDSDCDPSRLWHERLTLRVNEAEEPKYLREFIANLFAMGKEKMMENMLTQELEHATPPVLPSELTPLHPLDQQLKQILRNYAEQLRSLSASSLTAILLRDHHLMNCFNMLESIYLLKDATTFSNFSTAVYEQFRGERHKYLNDFQLTELARDSVPPGAISLDTFATMDTQGDARGIVEAIGMIRLHIKVPWFAANIVQARSPAVYEDVFTLLLQLAHTKKTLQSDFSAYRQCALNRLRHHSAVLYCLRHCMIAFIDSLVAHITAQGVHHHKLLKEHLAGAKTFDDMILAYAGFSERLGTSTFVSAGTRDQRAIIVHILELSEVISAVKISSPQMNIKTSIANVWITFNRKVRALATAVTASEVDTEWTEPLSSALLACLPGTGQAV